MRVRLSAARLILASLTALALMLTPGVAAADDLSDVERVLVEAALDGTLTDAQRQVLREDYPELAATLPDVGRMTRHLTVRDTDSPHGISATSSCKTVSGHHRMPSTAGFTLYRFHHGASFCYNGSTVTSLYNRRSWLTDVDPTIEYQGIVSNWTTGVNTSLARSFMQGHMRHCVLKYGCYANSYPWVQLNLYGNGSATYTNGR